VFDFPSIVHRRSGNASAPFASIGILIWVFYPLGATEDGSTIVMTIV
jgi:hypothetical protein